MHFENIIIGAGPASLQCAYFFKKYNINYLVLEKNSICGSFFSQYPHGDTLISINKKYTGYENKDFNLRHDWNSLLNEENHLFTDYSEEFYPKKNILVKYLNDFSEKNNLNILFNININNVTKDNNLYKLYINNTNDTNDIYTCNKLIIATGLSKPNIPESIVFNVKDNIKHYADYPTNFFLDKKNLETFKNKSVLILGGGNSSFELANILNEVSSSIFILGKNTRNWAISTHYAGDIRTIYIPFMDTFLLKSLNAIDYNETFNNNILNISQTNNGEKYLVSINNNSPLIPNGRNYYDIIILCTGWKFDNSIFDFNLKLTLNNKYPAIKNNYESINNNNLYFIGSLMHSLDFKKSSGGFIHGFRYLIKSFINLNYGIPFEYKTFKFTDIKDIETIADYIIYRINTSSDLYQMFGYIGDVFYLNSIENKIDYFYNVPINLHKPLENENIIFFILTLEYGEKVTDILKIGKRVSGVGTESRSTLIHPVLKIYKSYPLSLIDIIHFDEDLFAEYINENKYYNKLLKILKAYL